MVNILTAEQILTKAENSMNQRQPFSAIRMGSGLKTLVAVLRPGLIDPHICVQGSEDRYVAFRMKSTEGVPKPVWKAVCQKVVSYLNEADILDCYLPLVEFIPQQDRSNEGYTLELVERWKEFHQAIGVRGRKNYCSPYMHYFLFTEDRKNIFQILKKRKVFCISDITEDTWKRLKDVSGAKVVDGYPIPSRWTHRNWIQFPEVMKVIRRTAKEYDIFLTGAAMMGKIYAGEIRRLGGRCLDIGGALNALSGNRPLEKVPRRFRDYLHINEEKFVFERMQKRENKLW